MNKSTLHFLGGAGQVTGSNFLLDTGEAKYMIDCGLFQGRHAFEETNWHTFAFDPKDIKALLVTHAHIDHIGRIPKLVRDGFRGAIYSTEATKALAEPLLEDSMEILAHDSRKHGHELLYEEKDIHQTLKLWQGVPYKKTINLEGGFQVQFLNAGHILGSAMIVMQRGERKIVFAGDIGSGHSPLLPPIDELPKVDYLVMESVYGDRVREEKKGKRDELEDVIENTFARKGTLLIPAFSTERTQDLLYEIGSLMHEKRVASMPVFIDSPLATKITAAFTRYPAYFNNEIKNRLENGEHVFNFPQFHFVENQDESHRIANMHGPKIVIAGSGMSNGGRVHIHERQMLSDPHSTLLIVGYQAAGSLGRRLIEGDKNITLRGERIHVACHVETIYTYSAHSDGEGLIEFVNKIGTNIEQVFVVHGEPMAAATLTQRLRDYLSVRAVAPEIGEKKELDL